MCNELLKPPPWTPVVAMSIPGLPKAKDRQNIGGENIPVGQWNKLTISAGHPRVKRE